MGKAKERCRVDSIVVCEESLKYDLQGVTVCYILAGLFLCLLSGG